MRLSNVGIVVVVPKTLRSSNSPTLVFRFQQVKHMQSHRLPAERRLEQNPGTRPGTGTCLGPPAPRCYPWKPPFNPGTTLTPSKRPPHWSCACYTPHWASRRPRRRAGASVYNSTTTVLRPKLLRVQHTDPGSQAFHKPAHHSPPCLAIAECRTAPQSSHTRLIGSAGLRRGGQAVQRIYRGA